jgi:hypothetical protein
MVQAPEHQVPEHQVPEHHAPGQRIPDLEQAEAAHGRRGAKVTVAVVGAAWVTMAIVGMTVLRPELAMVKRIAERAVAGAPPILSPPTPAVGSSASAPLASSARWRRYADPAGFTIDLPGGWTRTYRSASQVRFTSPARPGAAIVIAYTATPAPDQYTNWEQQAAWKAETDSGYLRIGIHRVYYRGWNCADWEFTDVVDGTATRFLDHGFIPVPGRQAYAIELVAPASQWDTAKAAYWGELLASFTPAILSQPHETNASPSPAAPASSGGSRASGHPRPTPAPTTPTAVPTSLPTSVPTSLPTSLPTWLPTSLPTSFPTSLPNALPTSVPTAPPSLSAR